MGKMLKLLSRKLDSLVADLLISNQWIIVMEDAIHGEEIHYKNDCRKWISAL